MTDHVNGSAHGPDDSAIPVPMPEELHPLAEQCQEGINTFRILWHTSGIDELLRQSGGADRVGDAIWFCIGTIEDHLERMVKLMEAAAARAVDAACEAPADTPAEPDRRPASGDPSQRPDILESKLRDKIETVGEGMAALHTLVRRFADNEDDLDPDLRISLVFCIGQINAVLEGLEKLVESIEVRPKAPA